MSIGGQGGGLKALSLGTPRPAGRRWARPRSYGDIVEGLKLRSDCLFHPAGA